MHCRTEIRDADDAVPADFAFIRDVVLMDARLMDVEWNDVDRGSVAGRRNDAAGNRADAIDAVTRPAVGAFFGDGLVERVRGDWVANALSGRRRVIDTVAAANDGLVADAPCDTDTRRPIVLVGAYDATPYVQARVAGEHVAKIHDARIEECQRFIRRNYEAAELTGRRIDEIRIEVGDEVVLVDERCDQLIAQTEVERDSVGELPGVLKEEAALPVVDVHRGTWIGNGAHRRAGRPSRKLVKGVSPEPP